MKTSIYDELLVTCTNHGKHIPVYGFLDSALKETKPIVHRWSKWPYVDKIMLPDTPLDWPENQGAFCIAAQHNIVPGQYNFCVDVGLYSDLYRAWFLSTEWYLEGLLVFLLDQNNFDVIPLAKSVGGPFTIMPEMQLRFMLGDKGWSWRASHTGPVNSTLYRFLTQNFTRDVMLDIDESVESLGNALNLFLGSYYAWVQQKGMWAVHPAKEPRVKIKKGVITKVYDRGSVGCLEFIPENKNEKR